MEEILQSTEEKSAVRHYGLVMAFAVVLAVCVGALLWWQSDGGLVRYMAQSGFAPTEEVVGDNGFARSAPVTLSIPKINLDTTFVPPLGLNDDGTISVPDSYTEVGWYVHGATPGEIGPAVILGHVDSADGPAVFYSLGQLKKGDEVSVTRADGSTAVFVVDDLERYDQKFFPTEKVYGQIDYAGLRLVTCTGLYDHSTERYTHNLVVYATLKSENTNVSERESIE